MSSLRVGVTGTVEGCTSLQLVKLREVLTSWEYSEFHHGDAVGVDAQAHVIAYELRNIPGWHLGWPYIVIHPPIKDDKRAFCEGADEVREPKEYIPRDHDIVDEIDVLIAVPKDAEEQLRSGTWATVRYARRQKCVFIIRVNPDGTVRFG